MPEIAILQADRNNHILIDLHMKPVFVIDSIRTPIGKYGGALSSVRPDDLLAIAIKSLMHRNPTIDPAAIEDVIAGAANQSGEDNRNVARMAALLAGLPTTVAGNTVNRLCASGLQSIMDASRTIALGEAELMIAAGVESMSRAPFVMPKSTSAFAREPTAGNLGQVTGDVVGHAFEFSVNLSQGALRREHVEVAIKRYLVAHLGLVWVNPGIRCMRQDFALEVIGNVVTQGHVLGIAQLADRLGIQTSAAQRLLDLDHATAMPEIEAAFRSIGLRLGIEVSAAA